MKKYLTGLLLLILLSGCGRSVAQGPSPSETVEAFMSFVQSGEHDEANGLILNEDEVSIFEIEEEYRIIFKNLSYSNLEEAVNGSDAYVSLTISNFDFSAMMDEIMAEAFYLIFTDITERELSDKIEYMLIEKLTGDTAPKLNSDITVNLEMSDGRWKIIADESLADALTGGLISFAEYAGQWMLH